MFRRPVYSPTKQTTDDFFEEIRYNRKVKALRDTVSQMQHIEKIYFHKSRFFSKRLELKADFVV